jgi:hypothetical protein
MGKPRPWVGTANVLPGNICGHCTARLTRGLLTLSCWQCQSILIYPEKKEKTMTKKKKNIVITDVYAVVSAERTSLGDLARELNEANAHAISVGKPTWTPVGGPILRDHVGAQLLVVRKDELDLEE